MKICFYFPSHANQQIDAIFGSMYESFFSELRKLGNDVHFTTNISEIEGDVLVTSIGSGMEKTAARAMHFFHGPVILSVYNSYTCFYKSFLSRWRNRFLFAYNPDSASLNFKKYESVGIPYFHFPFGSDPLIFKPLDLDENYDITFLGNANSGFGRGKYIQKLVDYAKRNDLNVFLAGSGWDQFGFPYRIVKHGEETNLIYNQSKICINIHNDRQYAGEDLEMDANNRLFDLAMAACCQVSNGEKMVAKYFQKDEVATADDPDKWIQQIDDLLHDKDARNQLAFNARKRALEHHSWEKRAKEFNQHLQQTYPTFAERNQKVNVLQALMRRIDQYIMPPYLYKEIRIIRFILTKLGLYTKK
ncbi:MAG: putative spore maturation protein [Bacteroidota bacterium]|jgi:hypothetical protein